MATAAATSKTADPKPGETTPAAGDPKPGEKPAARTPEQQAADDDAAAAAKKVDDDKTAAQKVIDDAAAAAAAEAAKGKKTDDTGAPEKYTLKVPEGGRISDADLKSVETLARAEGWTNDEAQARLEQHAQQIDAMSTRFMEQTAADPTYGGDKLEATTKNATAALNRFRPAGTPRGDALREMLNRTGYGNNLEWVSLMADIGAAMGEDIPQPGSRAAVPSTTETIADKLYPDKK
jgi:hypothetical protein